MKRVLRSRWPVVDKFGVAEGCVRMEQMVCASSELDSFMIRRKSSEMGGKGAEYFLGGD